jgi:hypothetical protein
LTPAISKETTLDWNGVPRRKLRHAKKAVFEPPEPRPMKNISRSLSPLLTALTVTLLIGTGYAQEQLAAETAAKQPKTGYTYLSATGMLPPLPYHPYPDLPTIAVGTNQFNYDDSKVNYVTIRAEAAEWAAKNAKAEPEGNGGGIALRMMGEDLRLVTPQVVSNSLKMTITGNDPELPYDLYARANIVGTNAWTYLGRLAAGETNVTVPLGTNGVLFLQLGTTQDTDGDYLPDAFEVLVTQLDPTTPNTFANTTAGNLALQYLTNVPPVIVPKLQDIFTRKLELWPIGATPGNIDFMRWDHGVGGTWTNIHYVKSVPPQSTTNLITTWDAQGHSLSNNAPDMLIEGLAYRDWGYYDNPSQGIGYDYKYKIITKVDLLTGGHPLSLDSHLHVIQLGTVKYVGNPVGAPPVFQSDGMIPFQDITVLGSHPDNNGLVWVELQDNTVVDATPAATTNYTNYTFSLAPSRLELEIWRGGSNITGTLQGAWVGEKIDLECRLTGGDFTLSNFVWNVPPNAISNYVPTLRTGKVDGFFPKTNASVGYHWIDGLSRAVVSCTAEVNGFPLLAYTRFDVTRPDGKLKAWQTGFIAANNNWESNILALHFGNPGMLFEMMTNNAPGEWEFVQIINSYTARHQNAGDGTWVRAQGTGLDTEFPYPRWLPPAHTKDAPGLELFPQSSAATLDFSFTMHLMFKPPTQGIYVPIRKINWSFSAGATNTGSWSLTSATNHVDLQDQNNTAHPVWNDNFIFFGGAFVPE